MGLVRIDRGALAIHRRPVLDEFGQPEIQNLCLPAIRHKNIRRLDVAMHDSFFVRRIQRVRQLNSNFQRAPECQRSLYQQRVERLALKQFHGKKCFAAVLFNRVHRTNPRMIQR